MRNQHSHLPIRESPEQTAAKPGLRPDAITLQASEFLRFRCEISGWWKNCPSRLEGILEARFTGLRVTGHLAISTRFRTPRCESAGSNPRNWVELLLLVIKHKNARSATTGWV